MIETNWAVITGAPCSGKTAVIQRLAELGYGVVHEVARTFIEAALKRGKSLQAIKSDVQAFEGDILRQKCRVEAALDRNRGLFLDRAIPDSIAYFVDAGLDPKQPLRESRKFRYRKVFLMARLRFTSDAVRNENAEHALRLETLLRQAYENLGYSLIEVPVNTIDARVEFVLNNR